MATAATITNSEIFCPLCRNAYTTGDQQLERQPVQLPCGHTACRECTRYIIIDPTVSGLVCLQCPAAVRTRVPLSEYGEIELWPDDNIIAAVRDRGDAESSTSRGIADPSLTDAVIQHARRVVTWCVMKTATPVSAMRARHMGAGLQTAQRLQREAEAAARELAAAHARRTGAPEGTLCLGLQDSLRRVLAHEWIAGYMANDHALAGAGDMTTIAKMPSGTNEAMLEKLDRAISVLKDVLDAANAFLAVRDRISDVPPCRIAASTVDSYPRVALVPDGSVPVLVVTGADPRSAVPVVVMPRDLMRSVVCKCLDATGRTARVPDDYRICPMNTDGLELEAQFDPDVRVADAGFSDWTVLALVRTPAPHLPSYEHPEIRRIAVDSAAVRGVQCTFHGVAVWTADDIICCMMREGVLVAGTHVVVRSAPSRSECMRITNASELTDDRLAARLAAIAAERADNLCGPSTGVVRTVAVADTDELRCALADARAGDDIVLSPGVYKGPFVVHAHGTARAPIRLRGSGPGVLLSNPEPGFALVIDGGNWFVTALAVPGGVCVQRT